MTRTLPVLPLGIDFENWASQLRIAVPGYFFPIPIDLGDWWNWAEIVVLSNNFKRVPLPIRHVFPNQDDWKKWGAYLIETIYNNNI